MTKRTKMTTTSVLLPTLNEAGAIGDTIDRIKAVLPQAEIILIDGLSTDDTIEIAENKGAKILRCMERGKGKAVRMAFNEIDSDYVCMLDADGSYPPEELPKMLDKLKECDVVVGDREDTATSMSFTNAIGNRIITMVANNLYDKYQPDICSGMWVMKKIVYKSIDLTADKFEIEANLYTEICKNDFNLGVHQVSYKKRIGESKINISDGARIIWFLLTHRS